MLVKPFQTHNTNPASSLNYYTGSRPIIMGCKFVLCNTDRGRHRLDASRQHPEGRIVAYRQDNTLWYLTYFQTQKVHKQNEHPLWLFC